MFSAAAYDDSKQILYLRFRNTGDVYRYFELPAAANASRMHYNVNYAGTRD
jgi:hypothetical protein